MYICSFISIFAGSFDHCLCIGPSQYPTVCIGCTRIWRVRVSHCWSLWIPTK